jgi:hypothetical protein
MEKDKGIGLTALVLIFGSVFGFFLFEGCRVVTALIWTAQILLAAAAVGISVIFLLVLGSSPNSIRNSLRPY